MTGSGLDRATLANLDETVEVEMVTPRRDGSLSRRPIWVVVAERRCDSIRATDSGDND